MKGTAYFVKSPSKLSNLVKPHRVEDEVSYEIVRTIYLQQIDYENFATDLTVYSGVRAIAARRFSPPVTEF